MPRNTVLGPPKRELFWGVNRNYFRRTETKVAIDTGFPVNQADTLAKIESFNKHLFRPNTYLHKWWARRSGTTFRHILKQLCDSPGDQDYYAAGGLKGKIILDPMMGGGTTIHEAIRMGACVVGCDIDPIPVLQAKASLAPIRLEDKISAFEQFLGKLKSELSRFFITTCPSCKNDCEIKFVIYGLMKTCACGPAIFVDSLCLREESNGERVKICPETGFPYTTEKPAANVETHRIYEKGIKECPHCHTSFRELLKKPFFERYVPIVISGQCRTHGQFFKKVDGKDMSQLEKARRCASKSIKLPLQDLEIPDGPKSSDLANREIKYFSELFTQRQLLYIAKSKELLDAAPKEHRLWLGLLLSTSLEFNSLLCGYKGSDKRRPGAIRHVFSHHAYSFPHTAIENNPVFSGNASGTLGLLFSKRIKAATIWASTPIERIPNGNAWKEIAVLGESDSGASASSFDALRSSTKATLLIQQDASKLPLPDDSIDHVVTDPPYFDSVQYSDLSHFFRAWLKWFLPDAANWDYEVTRSAVAEVEQNGNKYARVLSAIWEECYRVLKKPSGRLIFTFHHWRPKAWAHLTMSLKNAGFELVNAYTVHSENPTSVHISNLRSLKHDSILVLKPRTSGESSNGHQTIDRIDTRDSASFCSCCADLLKYCLNTSLSEQEVFQVWEKALGA